MISAVVITYNEERHIKQCLDSAHRVFDEVVVIDAHSSDDTADIAFANEAQVYQKAWTGYGDARNYGADKASNDWIFTLDADEILHQDFEKLVREIVLVETTTYKFKRINFFGERKIRYGFYKPEWKERLYNRKKFRWNSSSVHEKLVTSEGLNFQKSGGLIYHRPFNTLPELHNKLDHYSKLTAQQWIRTGEGPSRIKRIFGPSYHFTRTYLLQLGILEGKLGFELAKAASMYSKKKIEYYRSQL